MEGAQNSLRPLAFFQKAWGRRGTVGVCIPAELRFEAIERRLPQLTILDGVSFTARRGEITALVGPSGCGKSTLLRIAAGLEPMDGGVLYLDDRAIATPHSSLPPEKRSIGLLFQDYALFPHLSVIDNVMFGLNMWPRDEARATARHLLGRVGLSAYEGRYPDELSGGEQQRVSLARAIAPRPGILLLDEPFSNLDRHMRHHVRDETLAILRETRATCIIVTHDAEEALQISDHLVMMRQGCVLQVGTPQQVFDSPIDVGVARALDELNEIEAVVCNGRVQTPIGSFDCPNKREGEVVVVGVRPERIALKPQGFCLPARVVGRRFLGDSWRLDVTVTGLEQPLSLRYHGRQPPELKSEISLEIDPASVLVFSGEQSSDGDR